MDIFALEMLVNYLECLCLSHSDEQAKGKLLVSLMSWFYYFRC